MTSLSGELHDQWLCPTSRKSSFSTWLNKESFPLQHRYRINETGANTSGADEFNGYEVIPNQPGFSDIVRSRLHSDTDTKESKIVHFDDTVSSNTSVNPTTGYGSLRKPVVINCANTSERYVSLG